MAGLQIHRSSHKSASALCKDGMEVQSLVFHKKYFNDKKARAWSKEHGFKYSRPDFKPNTIRLRQNTPLLFKPNSFRTIDVTTGIKAVVACPKKEFAIGGSVPNKPVVNNVEEPKKEYVIKGKPTVQDEDARSIAVGKLSGSTVKQIENSGYEFVKGDLISKSDLYWDLVGMVTAWKAIMLLDSGVTIKKKELKNDEYDFSNPIPELDAADTKTAKSFLASFDMSKIGELRGVGFTDAEIKIILYGIDTYYKIEADKSFGFNGMFNYREGAAEKHIDEVVADAKRGIYVCGLKYTVIPKNKLYKTLDAYGVSKEPIVIVSNKQSAFGEWKTVKHTYYVSENFIITHKDYSYVESEGRKVEPLTHDYWSIISNDKGKLLDFIKDLFSDPKAFVKDMEVFYNGLGGLDYKDCIEDGVDFLGKINIKSVTKFLDDLELMAKQDTLSQDEGVKVLGMYFEKDSDDKDKENLILEEDGDAILKLLNIVQDRVSKREFIKSDWIDAKHLAKFKDDSSGKVNRRALVDFIKEHIRNRTLNDIKKDTVKSTALLTLYMEYGGEILVGGKADNMTWDDIAAIHGVPVTDIINQAQIGIKIEREHTNDDNKAIEIVKDHLVESPKYYTLLVQMETKFDMGGAVGEDKYFDVNEDDAILFESHLAAKHIPIEVEKLGNGKKRYLFLTDKDADRAMSIVTNFYTQKLLEYPKNLSDLKKFITEGSMLKVKFNKNNPIRVGKTLHVVGVQTNGIFLSEQKGGKNGSWLPYERAANYDFTPLGFTVYSNLDVINNVAPYKMVEYEYVTSHPAEKVEVVKPNMPASLFNVNKFLLDLAKAAEERFKRGGTVNEVMKNVSADANKKKAVGLLLQAKDTGRYLILQRGNNCDYAGYWSILSGGVDEGETPEYALYREYLEELGVDNILNDAVLYKVENGSNNSDFYYFKGTIDKEFAPQLNEENQDFEWVNLTDLPEKTHPLFLRFVKNNMLNNEFNNINRNKQNVDNKLELVLA